MPAAAVLDSQMRLLLLSLGRYYEIKGRYSEALAAYRREQEVDPGNAQLVLVPGRILVRLERHEEALAERRRADQRNEKMILRRLTQRVNDQNCQTISGEHVLPA
jgi:tetratricopeptide (TPR) repeat protein